MQTAVSTDLPTYTRKVRAILYNRILIALGFFGIFEAGVLSLSHFWNVQVPCGGASDCEKVTNHPSSMLFGVIPLAYIGLGAYLFMTALAVYRSMPGTPHYGKTILVGYVASAFGMLTSIGLQFYSIFVILAICKWCMASAITMTATVIVHALLYQEVADTPAEELEAIRNAAGKNDFLVRSSLGVICILALATEGYSLRHSDNARGKVITNIPVGHPLIPAHPNSYGSLTAPVKVIEFADLNCPACQKESPRLKDFVRQHDGQICVVYRHCPLPMHKTSALAALIDCYASEKGKFWDYTMAVMGTKREIEDSNELFQIATSVGLDADDIKRRINNDKDPLYAALAEDENTAAAIGVIQTPTFVVELPNSPPKAFTGGGLFDAFEEKPYTDYLGKKS